MKAVFDPVLRLACYWNTPVGFVGNADTYPIGVCLKTRNPPQCLVDIGCDKHFAGGILHKKSTDECVVFGHGYDNSADEQFVWIGNNVELRQVWDID